MSMKSFLLWKYLVDLHRWSISCCLHLTRPEFTDAGRRADPDKPHLLTPNVITNDISPYLGTEVIGVQISQLSSEGLDELALYAAERKVLIFRDQDFRDLGPDKQIEIARHALPGPTFRVLTTIRHFGPLHKQPTAANVRGYPEFTVGTLKLYMG